MPHNKKSKPSSKSLETATQEAPTSPEVTKPAKQKKLSKPTIETEVEQYPILQNIQLKQRFLNVPLSNNQKGRIRQSIKDSLKGTSNKIMPSILHNKLQDILKSSENLTDTQLRRIRILYNLLQTSLKAKDLPDEITNECVNDIVKKKKKKKSFALRLKSLSSPIKKETTDGDNKKKVKGPKRYVVFVGNLPLNIDKEKIMNHFSEMSEHIKDIRMPKLKEGKRSAIAYVELTNGPSYEYALSKHHSMLGRQRISVLYTVQKNGKIMKPFVKSKSAKLIALQKAGKLVGSIPLEKKRSQRRLKLKQERSKEQSTSPRKHRSPVRPRRSRLPASPDRRRDRRRSKDRRRHRSRS